ncbi:MAG: ATP-binding protein, partial [Nitrospinota bacterium]
RKNTWTGELKHRAKNGKKIPVYSSISAVSTEEKKQCYVAIHTDPPPPQKTDTSEQDRINEVLKCMVEAILGVNREGICTFINSSFSSILKYKKNDVVGKKICKVLSICSDSEKRDDCKHCPVFQSMEKRASLHVRDAEFTRKDKKNISVEYWINPVLKEGVCTGAIISVLDNTLRKKIEKQNKLQQKQLLLADKMTSLGVMVSGVAHEINNPNNFIMLNSQTLVDIYDTVLPFADEHFKGNENFRLGKFPYSTIRTKGRELLSGISEGSKRIEKIVKKLKDFSRRETDEGFTEIAVNDIVQTSVDIIQSLITRSTNYFLIHTQENLPNIRGRYHELEQVLINLLTNSCQSLSGPEKMIEVSTFYQSYEKSVCIMVSDEGSGINKKNLKKIMDPFFTTKRETGGTGLGLSLSYSIVKKHGGNLDFSSEPGLGTVATLSLPVPFEFGFGTGEKHDVR